MSTVVSLFGPTPASILGQRVEEAHEVKSLVVVEFLKNGGIRIFGDKELTNIELAYAGMMLTHEAAKNYEEGT